MESGEGKIEVGVSVELSDAQKKARRKRNVAIAACLLGLVGIFYVATIVKIGPAMMRAQQTQGQNQ
ncbi:MAG: hypothetical protein ABJH63_08025 [Rhizobiaceae bacterium]